ncbi:MAG: acylphosphatase, partial [Firmicutes bacterium]|nr:acylphosphatase [Bacillota bacterium]
MGQEGKGPVIRANIKVRGIVQGVGFRPFIHRQVSGYGLKGWVRNTSDGAEIE